jgi:DNA-binding response OmpR family regulator
MHGYKNVEKTSDYKDVASTVSQGEIDLLLTDSSSNDEDITDLLYKIRYHQLGNNFFLAAIMLTADHTSNYIHKIINSAADDILAKHLAPNILINLIDFLNWKRKRFVVIGNDFDPNRRDITR